MSTWPPHRDSMMTLWKYNKNLLSKQKLKKKNLLSSFITSLTLSSARKGAGVGGCPQEHFHAYREHRLEFEAAILF